MPSQKQTPIRTSRRRIAVIGTNNSGKTVFLTSLLTHLRDHHPRAFNVGRQAQISNFELEDGDFKHTEHQNMLAKGEWPERTEKRAYVNCRFRRSDRMRTRFAIRFHDIPGTRLADLVIAKEPKYLNWSKRVIEWLHEDPERRQKAKNFLDFATSATDTTDQNEYLKEYKRTLGALCQNFSYRTTPSSFVLNLEGDYLEETPDTESWFNSRYCGIAHNTGGKATEFAPLPEELAEKNEGWVKSFSSAYRKYRKQEVTPLFSDILKCQTIVVLINIPHILSRGVVAINNTRELIRDLLYTISARNTVARKILNGANFSRLFHNAGGLTQKVAFVATRDDLVGARDREDLRHLNLLKELCCPLAATAPGVEYQYFTCAPIASTKPAEFKPYSLIGKPIVRNPERQLFEFEVPSLPPSWPGNWNSGEFKFPDVFPEVPKNRSILPRHIDLDEVFEFLI